MKVAVIGAGVAGLGAAWSLSHPSSRTRHEVVVFEREQRFGGHSCTVDVETPDGAVPVDMGFIVFNRRNYPNLVALLDHLGVATEDSNMSFAVSLDDGRFEYASSYSGFLAQRSNMVRPAFLGMTRDILRFNRLAPRLLERCEDLDFTIGHFIAEAGLGEAFRDRYLLPMASCIWSTPLCRMLDYPAQTMARFFSNHGLLTVGPQLQWRTVSGGSRSYVERIVAPLRQSARLATPATRIRRGPDHVDVRDGEGHWQRFDRVVLACHADQALGLLDDADARERDLLGRFAYSRNEVWLHGDASLMPRRQKAWASWNYVAGSDAPMSDGRQSNVSVTYWMNRLQNLPGSHQLFVSVNPDRAPDAATVHHRHTFEHPMFDSAAIRAQRDLALIQGVRGTYFCGSYCGYGFHEDALSAGLDVAEQLGAERPWPRPAEHRKIGMAPRPAASLAGSGTLLPPSPIPVPAAS
jgi:predicted NAD/FAD-binding protein